MSAECPKISVLLPIYNGEKTLNAALLSLLQQDYSSFEILALNDGSTDSTAMLLDKAQQNDARIRPLHLPHRGIAKTLNTGLAAARGQYIARMDADDICLPHRLRLQQAYLDAHPETGLIACRVRFGGDTLHANGFARFIAWMNSCTTAEEICSNRFRESPLAHPSVMFRATLPKQYGGYREGPFPEDWELWLRWMDVGVRMEKLPETLLIWNDPPNRLTRTDEHYSEKAFINIRALWLAKYLLRQQHKNIWVIGGGQSSRRRALPLQAYGIHIHAWIDIDPRKIGNIVHNIPVLGRNALPPPGEGFIIICLTQHNAPEEAAAWLEKAGYHARKDYLIA